MLRSVAIITSRVSGAKRDGPRTRPPGRRRVRSVEMPRPADPADVSSPIFTSFSQELDLPLAAMLFEQIEDVPLANARKRNGAPGTRRGDERVGDDVVTLLEGHVTQGPTGSRRRRDVPHPRRDVSRTDRQPAARGDPRWRAPIRRGETSARLPDGARLDAGRRTRGALVNHLESRPEDCADRESRSSSSRA